MSNRLTRRGFLKSVGAGASLGLLANAGLPIVAAAERSNVYRRIAASQAQIVDRAVELLVGDVIGFQLQTDEWEGAFGWVKFQLHSAYYNGDMVYYVRTDASDPDYAEINRLVFVPLLNTVTITDNGASKLYTFTNGAEEQFPVMNVAPGDDNYSSAWEIINVTFNGSPTLLTSAEEVEAADVTLEPTGIIVNHPIVKWTDGELPVDTELMGYAGTGPLASAVDTSKMEVRFKLHQCYPGSYYFITDASHPAMAGGMSVPHTPVTEQLAGVGGTDEIWVWMNGIPGSGAMGFQPAIFDNPAGDPVWSPYWRHFTASWNDESAATVVTSGDEVRELEASGALNVFLGVPPTEGGEGIVNCPVPIKAANTFTPDM